MTNQFMTWLVAAIAVLGGAIGVLWRTMVDKQEASDKRTSEQVKSLESRADKYETKYDDSIDKILVLTETTNKLEGRVEGYLEAKNDLQTLSENVLDIIHEKKNANTG